MRKLAAVLFCLAAIVPAFSQDLSEFDKGGARTEVETKCFIRDFSAGDKEELETFKVTRSYDLDGELRDRTTKSDGFSDQRVYLTEKDKDGRVIKRTEQRRVKIGDAESAPALRVWSYVYKESGEAVVICTEVEEEKEADPEDPNPVQPMIISEIWKLDASGRVLRYSLSLGDKENFRVEFERDEDGKLLTKTGVSGELAYSKETYTYRDDGTLKESDELVSFTMQHYKKEYGLVTGKECSGAVVDKDGKTLQSWTVERSLRAKLPDGSLRDETTYWIRGQDVERLERTVRYVVTTKQNK